MSPACVSNVTEMLYCPYCQGVTQTKPCNHYCLHVLKLCLWSQLGISDDWTRYIDAMLQLIERLEGPFNIESVMEPIDVKISDAIMTMQEKTMELSEEVFLGCGKPELLEKSRVSRDVSGKFADEFITTESSGTNLQKLVADVKAKLSQFRSFWSSLPEFVCQDENVAAPVEDMDCWDVEKRSWYANSMNPQSREGHFSLGTFHTLSFVLTRNTSDVFDEELIDFQTMINTLKRAYNGYQSHYDDSSKTACHVLQ
ncbi:glypican-6-like [Clarias magur]|uniref:Glypican-6-like n=1 Tax=Clarias magur TaxID=1594786 RepID=A0A8J4TKT9_CLAMG|nr:glypican-6-like [Clarias magur]